MQLLLSLINLSLYAQQPAAHGGIKRRKWSWHGLSDGNPWSIHSIRSPCFLFHKICRNISFLQKNPNGCTISRIPLSLFGKSNWRNKKRKNFFVVRNLRIWHPTNWFLLLKGPKSSQFPECPHNAVMRKSLVQQVEEWGVLVDPRTEEKERNVIHIPWNVLFPVVLKLSLKKIQFWMTKPELKSVG